MKKCAKHEHKPTANEKKKTNNVIAMHDKNLQCSHVRKIRKVRSASVDGLDDDKTLKFIGIVVLIAANGEAHSNENVSNKWQMKRNGKSSFNLICNLQFILMKFGLACCQWNLQISVIAVVATASVSQHMSHSIKIN
ncbi:CLUMA_CG013949, isoform A [Clunio marinus]|uniref:CLUMA_CG013949, isoform A n=1 Tax=Clunio marinus TaxID=568069 RepID=A0A1J1ILQ9_9DIPT|nr:CLUMA_CG013949, isoform A [Clunio marinus]